MKIKNFSKFNKINEDWGTSDQTAMNNYIHGNLGKPESMPSPASDELRNAAAEAVDYYWDHWEEYSTDYNSLVMNAIKSYLSGKFPETFAQFQKLFSS